MQFPQGAQGAQGTQGTAAAVAGVKPEQVQVHSQFIGGGLGRRLENDFVAQTVAIAKAVPGTPVQPIWTRPQDIQQDFYRPSSLHLMRGVVANGRLEALSARLISPSITARAFPTFVKNGSDPFQTEGLANLTYDVPNLELRTVIEEVGIRVGFWRSVSHALNAFAVESFMNELALAAGRSPVAFRLALLDKVPRQREVLERAARASGYTATPRHARCGTWLRHRLDGMLRHERGGGVRGVEVGGTDHDPADHHCVRLWDRGASGPGDRATPRWRGDRTHSGDAGQDHDQERTRRAEQLP